MVETNSSSYSQQSSVAVDFTKSSFFYVSPRVAIYYLLLACEYVDVQLLGGS